MASSQKRDDRIIFYDILMKINHIIFTI